MRVNVDRASRPSMRWHCTKPQIWSGSSTDLSFAITWNSQQWEPGHETDPEDDIANRLVPSEDGKFTNIDHRKLSHLRDETRYISEMRRLSARSKLMELTCMANRYGLVRAIVSFVDDLDRPDKNHSPDLLGDDSHDQLVAQSREQKGQERGRDPGQAVCRYRRRVDVTQQKGL